MRVSNRRMMSFLYQHALLLVALDVMTLGVALNVKSRLGCSVISALPYVFSLAGEGGRMPGLSIGDYTILMNFVFVVLQVAILRREFHPAQLFQLIMGFVFGWLIDFNMFLLDGLVCEAVWAQALCQLAGCTVLGVGIAFEIRCGSVTMPGEGITIAVGKVAGLPFAKAKMMIDTALVCAAVGAGYLFFGAWRWEVVGLGTLFAMIYVGYVVKLSNPWLDRMDGLLHPGSKLRHVYGLLRHRVGCSD